MKAKMAITAIVFSQLMGIVSVPAQSSKLVGDWRVQITFQNGESRSVRLEARASGKGSLQPLVPKPNQAEPSGPSSAEWSETDDHSLIVIGQVQFPLGNVGLERGTLRLKGKLEAQGSFTGEAKLFPLDQDPRNPTAQASKSGTFTAVRGVD